jgi:L-seryl-tRNA(Ser) seleniumtransferase
VENKQKMLSQIPSVDEILKGKEGERWLHLFPRRTVLKAIRSVLNTHREAILKGKDLEFSTQTLFAEIEQKIHELSAYKLRPLINATGVIIHTNLGRAILPERAIENIQGIARNYSNLEYDIQKGKRGKRYSHIKDIIKELTGAEDALVVNNNAAAVLLCLNTLAKGREVIVSRGELVEIGGSFRIPEVMKSSGAILREVGTTNKTHLSDYEDALSGNTALILKVHQSNYKLIGFTEEVSIKELVKLGRSFKIPVMADLGSGCMIDLEKYGIYGEPTVQDVIKTDIDIVTFSGDKLLGGPQAGIIVGKERFIKKIHKNPLLRALRVDKLTLASLEATLMEYLDEKNAIDKIPTIKMLTQSLDTIRRRARRIFILLRKALPDQAKIELLRDQARAGGGSLPETDLPTFVVSIKPYNISVNTLEERLRKGDPPIIARIRDDALLIDMRTVQDREVKTLVRCIISALS